MSDFVIKPRVSVDSDGLEEHVSIESKLKSAIVRIGDQNDVSLEDSIEQLVAFLEEQQNNHHDVIVSFLLDSVQCLPLKTPIYGSVVGLLNIKSFEFVGLLLAKSHTILQIALENRDTLKAKLMIRFLAELVNTNVILPETLCTIFSQFLNAALATLGENQALQSSVSAKNAYARADFLVYLVLITLPYVGAVLCEKSRQDTEQVMEVLDQYFSRRPARLSAILSPFDLQNEPLDRLVHLHNCVKECKGDEWENTSIARIYLRFSAKLQASLQHKFEPLVLPGESAEFKAAVQVFQIFGSYSGKVVCRPIDRLLLEDLILDTIFYFNEARKECVKQIASIELPYSSEEIVIETIFGQLLFLPSPEFKTLYYNVLLGDLGRHSPSALGVIYRAVTLMFERMSSMDIECVDRLADFMAYHLSNTDYKWDWSPYLPYASRAQTVQHYFMKGLIAGCVQFSHHGRIASVLPPELFDLLPSVPEPRFRYENGTGREALIARQFLLKLRMKEFHENVISWLNREIDFPDKLLRVDVVTQSCYAAGQKTFSHIGYIFEKYQTYLQSVCNDKASRRKALSGLSDFWQHDWHHYTTYIDRLLTFMIVSNLDVLEWLFSEKTDDFLRPELWRIVDLIIEKVMGRKQHLERGFAKSRRMAEQGQRPQRLPETFAPLLEESEKELQDVFVFVFRGLVEAIVKSNETNPELAGASSYWSHITCGHLLSIGRKYKRDYSPYWTDIEAAISQIESLPPHLTPVIERLKGL
eukprot:TRINITY_DN5266_c0_g1_i1.p1 TRINITY_DN5266_c0_g1~~TRINITY_DN5266_c0_g1_i1.p1  ORF type:complete len:755 (+),score=126.95 TRINITY_DN5266_c0_g1_i1:50-2314(+)